MPTLNTKELQVTITMPWSHARALAFAADVGINHWPKESDAAYCDLAVEGRKALLRDTSKAERRAP